MGWSKSTPSARKKYSAFGLCRIAWIILSSLTARPPGSSVAVLRIRQEVLGRSQQSLSGVLCNHSLSISELDCFLSSHDHGSRTWWERSESSSRIQIEPYVNGLNASVR